MGDCALCALHTEATAQIVMLKCLKTHRMRTSHLAALLASSCVPACELQSTSERLERMCTTFKNCLHCKSFQSTDCTPKIMQCQTGTQCKLKALQADSRSFKNKFDNNITACRTLCVKRCQRQ